MRAQRFSSVEGVSQGVVRLREAVAGEISRKVGNGESAHAKSQSRKKARKEFYDGFLNFRSPGSSSLERLCDRCGNRAGARGLRTCVPSEPRKPRAMPRKPRAMPWAGLLWPFRPNQVRGIRRVVNGRSTFACCLATVARGRHTACACYERLRLRLAPISRHNRNNWPDR